MKILCTGLSRTGTSSIHQALLTLGFSSIHYDTRRLRDVLLVPTAPTQFRVYDDVDAVSDLPAAWFYEELLRAYPRLKCIHTIRNEDAWWSSIERHFNVHHRVDDPRRDPFRSVLRRWVYGSEHAVEYLYRRRYREHNARVHQKVPAGQLLEMDVTAGEGWEKLCPFLGVDTPASAFPHLNNSAEDARRLLSTTEDIERLVTDQQSYILLDQDMIRHRLKASREAIPLPGKEGVYWGLPACGEDLVSEIGSRLSGTMQHVVVAWPAFWWLEHYPELGSYLTTRFNCVCRNERIVVFEYRGEADGLGPSSANASIP